MTVHGEGIRSGLIFLKMYGDRIMLSKIHAFWLHSWLKFYQCVQSCKQHYNRGTEHFLSFPPFPPPPPQLISLFHQTLGKHWSNFNPHGQNINGFRQPFMSGCFKFLRSVFWFWNFGIFISNADMYAVHIKCCPIYPCLLQYWDMLKAYVWIYPIKLLKYNPIVR